MSRPTLPQLQYFMERHWVEWKEHGAISPIQLSSNIINLVTPLIETFFDRKDISYSPSFVIDALVCFVIMYPDLIPDSFDEAISSDARTLSYQNDTELNIAKRLVHTIATAIGVFGKIDPAARWLEMPALGLKNEAPISLINTGKGYNEVDEFLHRIDYGVYQ